MVRVSSRSGWPLHPIFFVLADGHPGAGQIHDRGCHPARVCLGSYRSGCCGSVCGVADLDRGRGHRVPCDHKLIAGCIDEKARAPIRAARTWAAEDLRVPLQQRALGCAAPRLRLDAVAEAGQQRGLDAGELFKGCGDRLIR